MYCKTSSGTSYGWQAERMVIAIQSQSSSITVPQVRQRNPRKTSLDCCVPIHWSYIIAGNHTVRRGCWGCVERSHHHSLNTPTSAVLQSSTSLDTLKSQCLQVICAKETVVHSSIVGIPCSSRQMAAKEAPADVVCVASLQLAETLYFYCCFSS